MHGGRGTGVTVYWGGGDTNSDSEVKAYDNEQTSGCYWKLGLLTLG